MRDTQAKSDTNHRFLCTNDIIMMCVLVCVSHFCLVCGTAHKQHAPLSIIQVVLSPRNGAAEVRLITKVFVDEVILATDEHSTRSVIAARNSDQKISCIFEWFTVLSHDVIETKV